MPALTKESHSIKNLNDCVVLKVTRARRQRGLSFSQTTSFFSALSSFNGFKIAACCRHKGTKIQPLAIHSKEAIPIHTFAALQVCRICKKKFEPKHNGHNSCQRHTTIFSGRLLRVEPTETSDLTFFYDCCGATDTEAPGCSFGYHKSYSD